jgi:hypothetical protein
VKRWTINRIRTDDGLIGMYIEHDCSEGEKFVHIDTPFVLASDYDTLVVALDEYLAARKDWESRRSIEYGPRYARLVLANRKLLAALSSAKGTQG